MFSSIINNPQFVSMCWTSYVTISIVALFELTQHVYQLNIRVDELEFKYDSKLHSLAEQDVRIAELEKRLTIVSQNNASKIENIFHFANTAMLRVEQMDQTLKTHINEMRNSPKSSHKSAISTQTIETFAQQDISASASASDDWVHEDGLARIEEMITVEKQERKQLAESTYKILYLLCVSVYQGTQNLTARLQNLNLAFWNKDVDSNVLEE